MNSISSIWTIVLRHMRLIRREPNFLLYIFYWPLLDIIIWGFLGTWIAKSNMTQFQNYETVTLMGLLLWQVVGRGCNGLVSGLSEELWSNNIVNLFSLPLKLRDWIMGLILLMSILTLLTTTICMFIIFALYDVSIWYFISTFLLFFPPLFISCIWVGFIGLQIIISLGRRGVELANVFVWSLAPFSGAFYPIEVLPYWAQLISSFLPMSYIFQGMRAYVMHQQDPTIYLIKGYAFSIFNAMYAIAIFIYCFNRSKQKGLARLAD